MDIIRTGIGITKTIRNVGRLKEVATIFGRHGFAEFIAGPIRSYIPNMVLPQSSRELKKELETGIDRELGEIIGMRLRLIFEELGPAAVKLGQLLASREDIFDESFINQMQVLRDRVTPVPFDEVKEVIKTSLGADIESIFESIDENPIGTASIGVVYAGKLKSGEDVVIKVKRPNIDRMIETDFSILLFLIHQVEKVSEEVRYLGLSRAIEDFGKSLQSELNFHIEALNCQRLKTNLSKHDKENVFYIPEVYTQYCSRDVMVMERLKGVPFSRVREHDPQIIEKISDRLESGVHLFLKTFLQDGFFHADLHGGNFFYLENGQIGLIDFGLMGSLGKNSRKSFVAIIYALLTFNYENLVYEFLDVAEYDRIPDVDALVSDVRSSLAPFIGLTVQQTDLSLVFKEVIAALRKHQIFLPKEWYIVFRSLMTLDGVGKSLGIDFDLYSIMESDIHELVKEVFSKEQLIEEAIWTGKDFFTSARSVPRHLRWFTKEWSKKGYAFDVRLSGHQKEIQQVAQSIVFLSYCVLIAFFLIAGVLVLGDKELGQWREIPVLSWVFWVIAILLSIRAKVSLR